ncbi:MAG: Fe-S cluster assembly protein SufD [Sneathiella sp.]|nr:Fe-S cluster assembly protein SufD [Sneathiella sp.]
MKNRTPLAQSYLDRFETAVSTLPGHESRSVQALRRQGLDTFAALDFPHKRIEEWRYTNLSALTKATANEDIPSSDLDVIQTAALDAPFEMVFINGHFSSDESRLKELPEGITLGSIASSLGNGAVFSLSSEEDRALFALNTAFMEDGFSLHVDDHVQSETILKITFRNESGDQNGRHIRNVINLGIGSKLTLVEEHTGTGSYFSNPVTSISLSEGAALNHYKLQNESHYAYHLSLTDCENAKGSIYQNFTFSLGARISRNEIKTTILGSEAESHLNGAYLMRGKQHCDTTTLTEHKVPQNISSQVYKGVLDDDAHGVFQGKIHIFRDAQQVVGDQLSKALLLSDRAGVDCKPELEIHADDVKCSHGATSGELDEDALFYLQSRGIPEDRARKLLIEAFLADVMESIGDTPVKDYFNAIAASWLTEA